jgi:AcrR family transcriptional regulator
MNVRPVITARGRGRPARIGGKEALLDAALTLFAERGYHGASIPEIAAAAGMAPASIYRHVASKDALVNLVYRRCKTALGAALVAAIPPAAPLRERFDALWAALDRFAREEPRAFAFLELHHHGDYLDAESRAIELRVLAPIAAVVAHGLATGALRGASAPSLIITVWGAFVGMIRAARAGYVTHDASLSGEVAACAWAAIASTEHAKRSP